MGSVGLQPGWMIYEDYSPRKSATPSFVRENGFTLNSMFVALLAK